MFWKCRRSKSRRRRRPTPSWIALLELNSYDWLVFTSANGVTAFFDIFFRRFQDLRDIGGARIAAVGPATAAKLRELHLQVDLMPEEFIGKKIAAAFQKYQHIENVKMCLLRAEVANPELPDALEELGAIVDDIAIYKTVAETEDRTGAAAKLLEHGADWITFTSSSTVEHFHARFDLPKLLKKFPQMKLAFVEFDADDLAHAVFLHRHAVKHVGHADGALVVRDDDELRMLEEPLQHADEAVDVRFVERRVQLVQHAERAGLDLINREQQRHGGHRLLAAGQQRNGLQLFARRTRDDVNAAFQHVVFVRQNQIRFAAAENLGEHQAEVVADLVERLREHLPASAC